MDLYCALLVTSRGCYTGNKGNSVLLLFRVFSVFWCLRPAGTTWPSCVLSDPATQVLVLLFITPESASQSSNWTSCRCGAAECWISWGTQDFLSSWNKTWLRNCVSSCTQPQRSGEISGVFLVWFITSCFLLCKHSSPLGTEDPLLFSFS